MVKPKVWGWPVESCLCQTAICRLARRCLRLHGSQSNSDKAVEDDNLCGSGIGNLGELVGIKVVASRYGLIIANWNY